MRNAFILVFVKNVNFQFVELTRRRKLYKNNQQAGSLITRLLADIRYNRCIEFNKSAFGKFLNSTQIVICVVQLVF